MVLFIFYDGKDSAILALYKIQGVKVCKLSSYKLFDFSILYIRKVRYGTP
jgi:hypothetical protein